MRIEHLSAHKKWKMRHVCGIRHTDMSSARYYYSTIYYVYCTRGENHPTGNCISTVSGRRYDVHSVVTVGKMRLRCTRWCHHCQGTRLR